MSRISEMALAGVLQDSDLIEIVRGSENLQSTFGQLHALGKSAFELAKAEGFVGTQVAWLASLKGDKGDKGDQGDNIYQIAVGAGYVGTEAEFIEDYKGLTGDKGDKGDKGETGDTGDTGAKGDTGNSAFEQGKESGAIPAATTLPEWLASLVGKTAFEVAVEEGFVGDEAAWLATLKGDTGDTGLKGDIGLTGDKGDKGDKGDQGEQGEVGLTGLTGDVGLKGDTGDKGEQGDKGDIGLTGLTGDVGLTGDKGDKGDKGDTGKSAYEQAVEGGFVGDEPAWLASFAGASAFAAAVDAGFVGDEAAWLASLKGETGDAGLKGDKGETGDAGAKGDKGDTGDNGASTNIVGQFLTTDELPDPLTAPVDGAYVVEGELWVIVGNAWTSFGTVVGPAGKDGSGLVLLGSLPGIEYLPPTDNTAGDCYIINEAMYVWDTGAWEKIGQVGPEGKSAYESAKAKGFVGTEAAWLETMRGPQGLQGDQGEIGPVGPVAYVVSVKGAVAELPASDQAVGDGYLVAGEMHVWTGTEWLNLGAFKGDKGDQGEQGDIGPIGLKGDKGDTGEVGDKGDIGLTGDKGDKGDKGDQGDKGEAMSIVGQLANSALLPAEVSPADSYLIDGELWTGIDGVWVNVGSLRGEQGEIGLTGLTGDKGDKGDTGDTGAAFALSGTFATAAELPVGAAVGEAYTVDGDVYVQTASGFVNVGRFKGDKGDQGDKGEIGLTGDVGPKGDTGETGVTGDKGDVGDKGDIGLTGDKGDTGDVGPKGDTGPTGDKGDKGDTGEVGLQGQGIVIKGTKADVAELPVGAPIGDSYYVGKILYTSMGSGTWVDSPELSGVDGKDAFALAQEFDPAITDEAAFLASLKGETGAVGPMGPGVTILGDLASTADLPGTGTFGDGYLIGGDFYGWNGTAFVNMGSITGPQGPIGPIGVQGPRGEVGVKGDKGAMILNGPANPTGLSGNIGDMWINTTTREYFRKQNINTWLSLGFFGGGTVFDAPQDGKQYVRTGTTWSELVPSMPDAPVDGAVYSRKDGAWKKFNRYDLAIVDATTVMDLTDNQVFRIANTANRTLSFTNGPGANRSMTVVLIITGGAGVITWPASITWSEGASPVLGATLTTVILLWDGSKFIGSVGATV